MIRRLELEKNRALKYDLSSMVFLMVAAEPVRQKTLKKFIELTSPHGLSEYVMAPGYGLAENCVFVSCAYGEGKPILVDWQGRVSCGYVDYADRDVDVRIVDPQSGEERKYPEIEGEIWISRPSGGIGYWGRSELSETCSKPDPVKCTPEPAIWVWSSKGTCTSRVGSRISSLLVGGTFRRRNMRRSATRAGPEIASAEIFSYNFCHGFVRIGYCLFETNCYFLAVSFCSIFVLSK